MDFELNQEQKMWKEAVHNFVSKEVKPFAQEVDENSDFRLEVLPKMGQIGLLGLFIPEKYGGTGIDAISAIIAIEELGWACGGTALSIAAHNGLGCSPLTNFGSVYLKEKYLTKIASGENKLAALALTEPGAGSDLKGGVQTKAVQDGDDWIINGTKMWCTNASISNYIINLVRTDENDKSDSFSLILVPTNTPGVKIAPNEKKMGVKGSPTNAVTYEDVRVPFDHLIGKQGEGLQYTLATLDGGRISIGALSIGLAQAALEEASHIRNNVSSSEKPSAICRQFNGCSQMQPQKYTLPD